MYTINCTSFIQPPLSPQCVWDVGVGVGVVGSNRRGHVGLLSAVMPPPSFCDAVADSSEQEVMSSTSSRASNPAASRRQERLIDSEL